jgi:hypothetical protein
LPNTNTQQKQQRHTLQKQTPTHTHPNRAGNSAGDARVHYSTLKQQGPTSPKPAGIHPPAGSDVSEPQQCARSPPSQNRPHVPHPARQNEHRQY